MQLMLCQRTKLITLSTNNRACSLLTRSHCQTHCQSWACRGTEPLRQPVDPEPAAPHQLLTHPDN